MDDTRHQEPTPDRDTPARDIPGRGAAPGSCPSSSDWQHNLADHIPLSIMVFNAQGRVEFVNRWHIDVFSQGKLPASFFVGLHMNELPGLKSAGVAEAITAVFQGKRVFMDEVHVPRYASGRSGYQRIRCLPLRQQGNLDGPVCGAVLIREDITAHMLGKLRLQEAEAKYRKIFQSAPVGIFITTLDGHFLELNQAMATMMGYDTPRDALQGIANIATDCYVNPGDRHMLLDKLRQTGTLVGEELEFKRRDGSRFSATLHVHFAKDEFGAATRLEGMLTDTSARRQAEEELRQAKHAAEAANAAKSAFLASISHDLRTPLHHILGMAELAAAETNPASQLEYLRLQRSAGEHLLALVDDLLDLSVIESGKLDLVDAPFALSDLARDLQNLFALQAQAKGLAFTIVQDPALADRRRGDSLRLRQVLVNLAGNAFKFTEHGAVTVRILPHANGPEHVCFTVQDTGPGIPAHRHQDIFDPYVRVRATDNASGTGLGLAISRRLVQLMGGDITLNSADGNGATFQFILPLPPAQDIAQEPAQGTAQEAAAIPGQLTTAESPAQLPQRVLVVEDEPVSRLYSRTVLEKAGLQVRTVADGHEALLLLREQPFDAVVLDMHLHDMDGLAVLQALRALPADAASLASTPVLVITALAMRGDRKRILAAGANGYLSKPVNSHQLLHALALLRPPGSATTP